MIRVAIVEQKEVIREGLAMLIDGTEGYRCVGSFCDCETMLPKIERIKPDVLLMDIRLSGISGIAGVKKAKEKLPALNILILTVYEESELIYDAFCAGASGYLIKKTPPTRLLEAIREAHEGGSPMSANIARKVVNLFQQSKFMNLKMVMHDAATSFKLTEREHEILNGLSRGNSYQAIAGSLYISTNTVRYHIRNIYRKLHVHSQSEAVAKALRQGII